MVKLYTFNLPDSDVNIFIFDIRAELFDLEDWIGTILNNFLLLESEEFRL